jgi:hypothetical protein
MAASESARPLPPPSLPPARPSGTQVHSDSQVARVDEAVEPVSQPRVPGSFAPETAIDEQIEDLERWALANLRRDRNEKVRFWLLRGLAFAGATGAAITGGFGLAQGAIVLGAIGALAVAIDSAWPGAARSPNRRAASDLRELQNTLKLRWDKVRLAHADAAAPQRIAHALALLDAVQAKREEIGKYLGNADPSPGVDRRL